MYIYLIEVDLLSQVFCTLQTNAIAIDTLYCSLFFLIFIAFRHATSLLCEGMAMSMEFGVSCRGAEPLLGAEHGINHLTTTDGKDREERVAQLQKGMLVRVKNWRQDQNLHRGYSRYILATRHQNLWRQCLARTEPCTRG